MILYRLASLVLLALSFVVRPHAARCPDGRDLRTGIRRSGAFECWSAVVGSPDDDGTWGHPERGTQRDDVLSSRIYCTGGRVPVIVGVRTVSCQARHRPLARTALTARAAPVPAQRP